MADNLGYTVAFLGCGVIGAAAAVLLWLGLPERRQALAPASSPTA
jgi:predicted MFS family arabinose efflux permease